MPSLRPEDGGTTTYLEQFAPALAERCELHVATLTATRNVALAGTQIHVLPYGWSNLLKMVKEWRRLLKEIQPDVVQINCCWMLQCALLQMSVPEGTPVVLMPHGMLEPWIINRHYYTRKLPAILLYQRWCVSHATLLFATCREEKEHLEALGWNKSIEIIPNCIDAGKIPVVEKRPGDKLRLLFMSRLHPKKGLPMLLEAMSEGMSLTVVGEGDPEYVSELKRKAEEQSRRNGFECRFPGAVYGDSRWQLFADTDLFVLPTYSENFGLCVAEALATGTPVLTTTGTPWGGLKTSGSGWCVEPETNAIRDALAEAARLLKGHDATEFGVRARQFVTQNYDVSALVNQLMKHYDDVAKNNN